MPVVINELEVVVEPAPPASDAPAPAPPAPGLTPVGIRDVTRHLESRLARVRAD
jgi:hypothetical protein